MKRKNKILLLIFFLPKWEAWNGKKEVSHYTCCDLRDLACREFWWKMVLQKASQIDPKWTTWAPFGRHFEIQGCFRKMWFFDEFWSRQNSIKKKDITNLPNDIRHLDFGWLGGMCGPAGMGGRVKTLQTWSGRGLILESGLGFQNLNSLIQHAMPSLREGRRIARPRIPPGYVFMSVGVWGCGWGGCGIVG